MRIGLNKKGLLNAFEKFTCFSFVNEDGFYIGSLSRLVA
jgi:hypothetical protein